MGELDVDIILVTNCYRCKVKFNNPTLMSFGEIVMCVNCSKEISNTLSLPTKDDAVTEGFKIANDSGYNYRRVLKDPDDDIYFSGWMDCFDWISKIQK